MVMVHIPSALQSYTGRKRAVEVEGTTIADILSALDRRHPGIRFRVITEQDTVREHIRIFVNDTQARTLETPLGPGDEIHIVCALSGG